MDKKIKSTSTYRIGLLRCIVLYMINQGVLVSVCMRVEGRYELVRSTENKPSVINLYMPTIYVYVTLK